MISWIIKTEVLIIHDVKFTSYCELIECSRPIRFFIVSLMYNNNNNDDDDDDDDDDYHDD